MKTITLFASISVLLLNALFVPTAAAVDGVVEINQTCALTSGCVLSDTPGFPVTIEAPGSYRLTSNLDRSSEPVTTDAIVIDANDVALDLNGFTIQGATTCIGNPVTSCSGTGAGRGVVSFNDENVTVRNGTVRQQPAEGIRITGNRVRIENVNAIENGDHGIEISNGRLSNCTAARNGGTGIETSGGILEGNVAEFNKQDGMQATTGSLVIGNRMTSNGGFGLQTANTKAAYGGNVLACNNSTGSCTNGAQVSHASAIEVGVNACGTDTTCP